MLNEGAPDCLLPITRKGSDDVFDSHRPPPPPTPSQHQSSYSDHLLKKWTERVDRCLEQQWKDSHHLLSFAKALKDSDDSVINSDDLVKKLSGLGFAMMQKSIDLRQEIVNESYNNDFFDCHIKKPVYQYQHDNNIYTSQPQLTTGGSGVLNSPRQKCSSTYFLPLSSQLKSSSIDTSPYKIPSQVSCQGYTSSYTYQNRQQRTRSDSFTQRHLTPSNDKKNGLPLLSSSPSISNVCGLSLQGDSDVLKNQQHKGTGSKNDTFQHQCTCNTNSASGKATVPVIRCQLCTPGHSLRPDHKASAFDQAIATHATSDNNNSPAASGSDIEGTSLTDNECNKNGDQTGADDDTTTTPLQKSRPSSPVDTNLTATTPPKTNTLTPVSSVDSTTVTPTAASLAVHITPSTPSSSSSMVHTMSTKFHFTRSTTSMTATDRNKTMSRSSSSSSSSSSSASLFAATPLSRLSNKDGGKSSTRLVQSILGRKTSLPALFSSSKKDQPLSSPKNDID